MDLIEDYKPIFLPGKVQLRLGKLCPVSRGLQVEIDARSFLGEDTGKGRLPDLPRPCENDSRELVEVPLGLSTAGCFPSSVATANTPTG